MQRVGAPVQLAFRVNRSHRLSEFTSYVQLPHAPAADVSLIIASEAIDSAQFAARQVEFIRHVFGYIAYLREQARETPVSDAFLPAFVTLLEVLQLNAPVEADQCAAQLIRIMKVTFPDLDFDAAQILEPSIANSKRPDA
jgi:hypothetical protein